MRVAAALALAAGLVAGAGGARAQTLVWNLSLESCQETPPFDSAATGHGVVTYDEVTNTLDFDLTFSGLTGSESAAHIHGPGARSVAAGVLFALPAGSPKIGQWIVPDEHEADLLAGLLYVNIHSEGFPDGELRGQIDSLGSGCSSTALTIAAIQGSGSASPVQGREVTTTGVVTGRRSNGFFLQMASPGDSDPATSDGIFVFTASAPPAGAAVGNLVTVTGTVLEFVPAVDPASPSVTQIAGDPSVVVVGSGVLPAPVALEGLLTTSGGLSQLERYEGMRVSVAALTVVGPSEGFFDDVTGVVTSTGVFWGVLPATPRPAREPGVTLPDRLPSGAPATVPRWDANPERIRVDSDGQPGAAALEVAAGQTVSGLVGPLDYGFRGYTILPDPGSPPVVSGSASGTSAPAAGTGQITVASLFADRLYDDVDDPMIAEPVTGSSAYGARLAKLSLAIRTRLSTPGIIVVGDVENLAVLEALSDRIDADALATGQPPPGYTARLIAGDDATGLDVGVLVRTPELSVVDATQVEKAATFVDPATGLMAPTFRQPPLVLHVSRPRAGLAPLVLTVIAIQLEPGNRSGSALLGATVRARRRDQAQRLASVVQTRQSAGDQIVVMGHFGGTELNDGYVDVVGTVRGTPAPSASVVLASSDVVDPDLQVLAAATQYTTVVGGNTVVADHALLSANLPCRLAGYAVARLGADFPESRRSDAGGPERASSHDAPVLYLDEVGSCECGDGVVSGLEACDDAGPGDCCTASCQREADATPCDDGDACSTGDTCAAGTCVAGGLALSPDPAAVSFPDTDMGVSATARAIVLTNSAAAPITLASATTSLPAIFPLTGDPTPVTLAPGESATFQVGFAPVAPGTQSATLTVATCQPLTVTLSGSGLAGDPDEEPSGCSCRTAPGTTGPGGALVLLALALLLTSRGSSGGSSPRSRGSSARRPRPRDRGSS